MTEWKEYKLGDLCDIKGGKRLPRGELLIEQETNHPYIRITDLGKKWLSKKGLLFVKPETQHKIRNYIVSTNDVILSIVGTIGLVARIPQELHGANLTENCVKLKFKSESVNPDFIYYFLVSSLGQDEIEKRNVGSTQPKLPLYNIKNINLTLPPLHEQTAIAEVLSSLDDKIDLLHRQNKTLEQLAETLFRRWFVEEADESWGITTLSQHTEVLRGLSYKGNGLTEVEFGIPMHNLNSVYEFGGYKSEGIKYYNGEYKERHLVDPGDIIVTNTEQGHEFRLIGYPGIVPKHFGEKGIFSQHIYRILPLKKTYLTNQFLFYLLMTTSIREQINGATNGSTVNMLSIEGLQLPNFKLPPKDLVANFSVIVNNYWNKKELNNNQIKTLTKLRDTLLPKLMSGEVRVIDI